MACRTFSIADIERSHRRSVRTGDWGKLEEIVKAKTFHGMTGFTDRGIAAHDESVYREHNITHTDVVATEGGGRVRRAPAPKGGGCICGNCAAHCKRAAVTGVASPGKEL